MSTAEEILNCLDELGIAYQRCDHEPVHTMEDCAPIAQKLNAVIPKNCFLTTRNRKTLCLYLVGPDKQFNASAVSASAGTSRLGFGSETLLMETLHTKPGAVSPLGLIFDSENRVQLLIDKDLRGVSRIAFHPCDNTICVAMSMEDFLKIFLPAIRREPIFV